MQSFIIAAPLHTVEASNGVLYLIRLGQALQKLGFDVYYVPVLSEYPQPEMLLTIPLSQFAAQNPRASVFFNPIAQALKTYGLKLLSDFSPEFIQKSYVLYGERIIENPLNAKHVIRLFGNKEGVLNGGKKVNAGPHDFILTHSKMIHPHPDYVLFFAEVNPLFNAGGTAPALERHFDVSYIGKGRMYGDVINVQGAIVLDRNVPSKKEGLAVILRNTRFFLTMDALSLINAEAALCGAIPVIMRYAPWTPKELDNMELGPLPRMEISKQGNIDINLPLFTRQLDHMRARIAEYNESWDERVAGFAGRVTEHFSKADTQKQSA